MNGDFALTNNAVASAIGVSTALAIAPNPASDRLTLRKKGRNRIRLHEGRNRVRTQDADGGP
jgi:hypothetical protein